MAFTDIAGQRFGRTVAVERTGEKRWGVYIWRCICDCQTEHSAAVNSLRSGLVKSCGCLAAETAGALAKTHGQYGTPAYKVWDGMMQRCGNPNNTGYKRYGGAGITVCERWRDFANFLSDMGERPKGLSIDRIDNTRGYEPGNCRWATSRQQRMNQSVPTITLEQASAIRSMRAATGWGPKRISEDLGVSRGAVSGVLYLGNLA